jgi:hypothetical protein
LRREPRTTYNPHAKRKGPSKTFDTFAEAFAWAQAEEHRMDRAVREDGIEVVRRGAPIAFAAYAATWTRGGPPSTQNNHRANARALAKVWPTQKLADISTAMVKSMLHDAEVAGLSVSTRTARLTTVRHIMQDAIAEAAALRRPHRRDQGTEAGQERRLGNRTDR